MENAFRVISPCSAPISSPINLFYTVIVLFTRLIIYFFRQLTVIYPAGHQLIKNKNLSVQLLGYLSVFTERREKRIKKDILNQAFMQKTG
ncbi:hypothetical protein DWX23_03065 [Parabacteroides sp. AF18-52]|nr:hypothetical protein DWX23_03065 [Parabacteroides sp. AF18-52]